MNDKRCKDYCGIACCTGMCPNALNEDIEYESDLVNISCNECFYYKGCDDCYFADACGNCDIENVLKGKRSS